MMEGSNSDEHPRLILRSFLSENLCKELEFIHRSCCTLGYRPNVLSTTLPHLFATNSSHLIMPFIPIRDTLKEKVEEHFGCEYELFVEFTGLISWCKGASIGWHSDDNRDYLKQRDFAAVCYLNSYGVDFEGGLFHFQDGEHSTVVPMAGDVIIYTADQRNIHSVDEITKGERITLTLWFTRDASHDEDARLLKSLSELPEYSAECSVASCFPVQAPDNMYWFPPEEASNFQSGFDIRLARLHVLGFDILPSDDEYSMSAVDSSSDMSIHLVHQNKLLTQVFVNILHALQVVQFYHWKAPWLKITEAKVSYIDMEPLSELRCHTVLRMKVKYLKNLQLAETLLENIRTNNSLKWSFDNVSFSTAVSEWESHMQHLREELVMCLTYWKAHQSIFHVAASNIH